MKELILGLRGWSFGPESERTDYGPDRAYLGPDRADLKPDLKPGGRTDRRTDGRTSVNSPLCPTGHWPFGVPLTMCNPLMTSSYLQHISA